MSKEGKTNSKTGIEVYREIAQGVYLLEVGKGISRSNVYFVQSGSQWVLIDAASANCGQLIRNAAESLFGPDRPPSSILLTHDHPDHAGSALELAHIWGCQVYVHPDELPVAAHGSLSTFEKYANPLDRWAVLPLLRIMPQKRVELMISKASLKDVVQTFDPGVAIADLPGWECIPTPGHTPGHIAFFRAVDRVLISGDAVITADLNSLLGFILWSFRLNQRKISGPPWYSTWNKQMANESIIALSRIEPNIVASGHGMPVPGEEAAQGLHSLADRTVGCASTKH